MHSRRHCRPAMEAFNLVAAQGVLDLIDEHPIDRDRARFLFGICASASASSFSEAISLTTPKIAIIDHIKDSQSNTFDDLYYCICSLQ